LARPFKIFSQDKMTRILFDDKATVSS